MGHWAAIPIIPCFLLFTEVSSASFLVCLKFASPEVPMESRFPKVVTLPAGGRMGKFLLLLLTGLLPLVLSGCATKRLKVDFTGFEKAYAQTSNQELLLNLARLENRDPTYFFKIGSIQSTYKMAASVGGAASYALQTTNIAAGSPTGGGTPSLSYENDPVFTFIPVNDQENAQLLLKPIPPESFYFLYEQGWRVDQLVRLMVDRLELTRYDKDQHTCTVETIRNTPPNDYRRDQASLSSYATFLRISAIAYWLQRHGYLLLRGTNTFVPYSLDNDPGLDNSPAFITNAPKGQDFVSAAGKTPAAIWHLDPKTKTWLLGEKVFSPIFSLYPLESDGTTPGPDVKLVPGIKHIEDQIREDSEMSGLQEGPALHEVLKELAAGFTIEGSANLQDPCASTSGKSAVSAHLVMRSLIGLMAAAAQEQAPFEALVTADPAVLPSAYLTREQAAALGPPPLFLKAVPAIEQLPVLRLTGSSANEAMTPIIQLNYRGKNYRIADESSTAGTDNQYWNRDVFRLINQLTSQVTVDISKFPLTEILQQ